MLEKNQLFRECEVLSVTDDLGGLRIKVRFDPEDNEITRDEDLPYCFPLLPKHFHINPKIGEMVLVITSRYAISGSKRWFIGPIVSQQYGLKNEQYLIAQSILEKGRITKPLPNPDLNPDNKGTIPEREDICIQGRDNADLILKENEVRLRCGFKNPFNRIKHNGFKNSLTSHNSFLEESNYSLNFNKEDLSYIQMKYKRHTDHNNRDFYSTINVVADRINLLSHDSRTPFTLNDPNSLITDNELLKILREAHPLPYGDELVDFLKKLVDVIRTHTHPFPMNPPSFSTPQNKVLDTNLDDMLSTSIRIN